MVISNQWGIWKASNSKRAQKVKALVLDDNWWARVQFVLDFTKPIMTMLHFADTEQPCLGDVYHGMDTMVEKVKLAIQTQENDPTECEALCNTVETIIHHRWEKMTTPLHLLAYALSLRYYSKEILSMPEVASSSAAERNWSTYSFIHSMKRNRLGSKKAKDLVNIHTNLHLLSRKEDYYKEGAAKLWDVPPECANFDDDDDDDNIMTHVHLAQVEPFWVQM